MIDMAKSAVLSLQRAVYFGYFEMIAHLDENVNDFRLLLFIAEGA